ncbi:MAG: rod shape-determining protein RodA [Clostridia bacterium]|nr:rod shape-determining protein RodA [Clostridia bacterium]MBR1683944.1 rod shape-determining protein RodA [Clostridia bacterium]
MIAENRRSRAHTDWFLIIMVMGLSVFGILCVAIATYSTSSASDVPLLNHIVESSYAMRQSLYVLIAPIIMTVLTNIPYQWFKRFARPLFILSNVLLFVVWIFNRAAGVKAWLDTLWGFTIQPSEFAKLSMILILAKVLSQVDPPLSNGRNFFDVFSIVAIPSIIIIGSGEMGSLLVIFFMFAVMLWFSGVDWKLLVGLGVGAVIAIGALFAFLYFSGSDSYRLQRILAFLNPAEYSSSSAYQQTQSKMTIGSGGMQGIGMFVNGAMSQLNYVPADWTDFIFATIGEAFGFVGSMVLIAAYLVIIIHMLVLAYHTYDKFGSLVIIGVLSMLLFHVFENIGMCIGIMPITGIPLPFLSYGGSNMVTNMGGIGLVLNVTKNRSLSATSGTVNTPQKDASIRHFQNMRSRF